MVEGDTASNFLQRSPLSTFPVDSAIPGLLGFFQVDSSGRFSSPLLPQREGSNLYGLSLTELKERRTLHQQIQRILSDNRLVQQRRLNRPKGDLNSAPQLAAMKSAEMVAASEELEADGEMPGEPQMQAQAAFDLLNSAPPPGKKEKKRATAGLGRVEDLKLEYSYKQQMPTAPMAKMAPSVSRSRAAKSRLRKEISQLPEAMERVEEGLSAAADDAVELRISTFESEIDGFELSLLDSGHWVLFRKVWRAGERYIQGALIEQERFANGVIGAASVVRRRRG